jgi:hypothetical protein
MIFSFDNLCPKTKLTNWPQRFRQEGFNFSTTPDWTQYRDKKASNSASDIYAGGVESVEKKQ